MKTLVVYNICEISGRSNWGYYVPALYAILDQNLKDFDVCVSGCQVTKQTEGRLKYAFGNRLSYSWVNDVIPLNTTFNHAIRRCMSECNYDAIIYIDSGIDVGADRSYFSQMVEQYKLGKHAMIALQVDTDSGYPIWNITPPRDAPLDIPIGKTVNLHIQLFGKEIFDAYDRRVMPDIFASDTSESIFTFMCAAIGKKFCLLPNIPVKHRQGVDGPSMGFRNKKPLLYRNIKNINQICAEGSNVGFGYEELKPVLKHNTKFYDENGNHKNPETLKSFLRDNVFFANSDDFYNSMPGWYESKKEFNTEEKIESVFCFANPSDTQSAKKMISCLKKQSFQNWKCVFIFEEDIEETDDRIIFRKSETSFIDIMNSLHSDISNYCIVTYLVGHSEFYNNCFASLINVYNDKKHIKSGISCCDKVLLTNDDVIYNGESSCTEMLGMNGVSIKDGEFNLSQFSHLGEISKSLLWHEIKNPEDNFIRSVGNKYSIFPISAKTGLVSSVIKII